MNFRLVIKLLGILVLLLGGFMLFSLIWAWPKKECFAKKHSPRSH